jgi:hypothetical protein
VPSCKAPDLAVMVERANRGDIPRDDRFDD